ADGRRDPRAPSEADSPYRSAPGVRARLEPALGAGRARPPHDPQPADPHEIPAWDIAGGAEPILSERRCPTWLKRIPPQNLPPPRRIPDRRPAARRSSSL